MRLARHSLPVVILCLLGAWPGSAQNASSVTVQLELSQDVFYAGDRLNVRITVRNEAAEATDNPFRDPLFSGFQVKGPDGKRLKGGGKGAGEEPDRPARLGPNSFYGAVVDLKKMFPDLAEPGTYEIRYVQGQSKTVLATLKVRVVRQTSN